MTADVRREPLTSDSDDGRACRRGRGRSDLDCRPCRVALSRSARSLTGSVSRCRCIYFSAARVLVARRASSFGRSRAARLPAASSRRCIRCPSYHGAVRRARRPRADAGRVRRRRSRSPTGSSKRSAIVAFDPADRRPTRCSAARCCATSRDLPPGSYSGDADARRCEARPPRAYASARTWIGMLVVAAARARPARHCLGLRSVCPRRSAPAITFERVVKVAAARAAPASRCSPRSASCSRCCSRRMRSSSQQGLAARLPVRHAVEPADRDARRPGRLVRRLRHRAAGHRHAADHHHRDADRRARSACSRRSTWPNTRRRAFARFAKPILEILAGIPTVVLGFFAALTLAPLIRGWRRGARPRTSPPKARSPPASSWE